MSHFIGHSYISGMKTGTNLETGTSAEARCLRPQAETTFLNSGPNFLNSQTGIPAKTGRFSCLNFTGKYTREIQVSRGKIHSRTGPVLGLKTRDKHFIGKLIRGEEGDPIRNLTGHWNLYPDLQFVSPTWVLHSIWSWVKWIQNSYTRYP